MNPGLHSGRDLREEKLALKDALAGGATLSTGQDAQAPDAVETPATKTPVEPLAPALSAAHKAFDLFDAGKLGETALLVALGVSREGYALEDDLRMRALTAFEQGRLSEDALIKVFGS